MRRSTLVIVGAVLWIATPHLYGAGASAPPTPGSSIGEEGATSSWPFETPSQVFSTPVTGDLDGDGVLEVAFCSRWDGRLFVTDTTGRLLWRRPLFEPGVDPTADLLVSVVIADVDDDPITQEIVATSGYGLWGRIYVLDAKGNELATFDAPTDIYAPPVVVDTDGDGTMEVYFATNYFPVYHRVDLVKQGAVLDPTLMWSVPLAPAVDGIRSPAAAADLFGDGSMELVVSATVGNHFAMDPADGSLHWSATGQFSNGLGAPVAVDLDGDGRVEILTGCLQVREGRTGELRWRLDTVDLFDGSSVHTPVAFDFDGDGTLEVVLAIASFPSSQLALVSSDGNVIWTVDVPGTQFGLSSPAVGDIDQDGEAEIVVGTGSSGATPSFVLAFDRHGTLLWQSPQESVVYCSPSLTDLDGDGFLETLFGVFSHEVGVLDHRGRVFEGPLTVTGQVAPWPSMHRNLSNNRVY